MFGARRACALSSQSLALVVLGLIAGGCGGGGTTFLSNNGPPTAINITGGNNQTGTVGTALGMPLTIQVVDMGGNPVHNLVVNFAITSPAGGLLSVQTTQTDPNGNASSILTLPPTAGSVTVTVTGTGLFGQPIVPPIPPAVFTETATAASAAQFNIVSGNGQTGVSQTVLPAPLVVQALDANGNPIAGLAVTWAVASGGGTVTPGTSTTDASGKASTTLALGPGGGTNTVTATAGTGSVTFVESATLRPPRSGRRSRIPSS
jgi:hypothetical protein